MALENILKVYPGEADGATTKGLFGKFNSDGEIAQIASLDDVEDGVLSETVTAAGEAVGLKTGRVSIVAGETIIAGNRVSAGADGKAYVNPNGRWKALSGASADGEFAAVPVAAGPFYSQPVAIAAKGSAGVQEAWQNPTGASIFVTRVILDVTTASAGAATLDIGYTATSAATSSDTALDGVDVNAATGTFDNIENQGTNGKATLKMASGKWITVDHKAATTGLVGTMTIEYIFA